MQSLLDALGNRWLVVTSISCDRRDFFIQMELFPPPKDGTPPAWLVSCRQVREFSLTDFDGGGLNWWTRGHPLVSLFASPKASLKVALGDRSRAECLGLLLQAHRQAVQDWIAFEKFVRPAVWNAPSKNSFLIAGPEFLLEAYTRMLEEARLTVRMKRHKRALYWSGFGWTERRHKVSIIHFGNSYVVAESFAARPAATMQVRS